MGKRSHSITDKLMVSVMSVNGESQMASSGLLACKLQIQNILSF